MQFFLLVIINVFLGAIFYLIISLKLERSASEFRSQRFRKEMDEIIKEFNATAERNITILENRISVLQRLLARSGQLKSLDVSIGDEGTSAEKKVKFEGLQEKSFLREEGNSTTSASQSTRIEKNESGLLLFSKKIIGRIHTGMNTFLDALEKKDGKSEKELAHHNRMPELQVEKNDYPSTKIDTVQIDDTVIVETVGFNEDEINEILRSTENRYDAISKLYKKGYSLEMIAMYSGIPIGEISLVLNLQNNRTI